MKRIAVVVWLALGLGSAGTAQAQREVTLVAPGGIRAAVEQLTPGFERKTGIKLKATFGSGAGTKQQVVRGEPFDVPILQPPYPEVLASLLEYLSSSDAAAAYRANGMRPDR